MDLVLTSRTVEAKTLHEWGLVSRVVDASDDISRVAIDIALDMCKNSPDALIIGRLGVRMSWEDGSVEGAVSAVADQWYPRLMGGTNFAEGIQAFVEKRPPKWVDSKL